MKRKTLTKLTACGLVGALTVGNFTVGVVAAPTAGITSYTTNIVTSSVLPTAGISLAMSECATTVEDEAVVASAQPEVKENEAQVVASEYADIAVSTADNFVYIRKKASAESKLLESYMQIMLEQSFLRKATGTRSNLDLLPDM